MKIVTFGELMLRLAPQGYLRFVQADSYQAAFGGGEANVAVGLANFGEDACFVTKLPAHEIGQAAVNSLRRYGVDTSRIIRGGKRVGIYFIEKGASQRASKVIYDRAGAAIAEAEVSDFDWECILSDAKWLHFTGITPALSDNLAAATKAALITARQKGITVSCDLNYRSALWTSAKANEVMSELMPYVHLLIANEEDSEKVFGIKSSGDITRGEVCADGHREVAKQLVQRFGCKLVAITLRGSISASDNRWAAMLYDGSSFYDSKEYLIHIVDRVGGGDSFAAGLIYGLTNYGKQSAIEFAAAASCLKQTIEGDFNLMSVDEVTKLANGDGSGRVTR